ncbi:hypothetical protein N665_0125s0011 [Sinapis alba]|nr:hypothetical protein N665_0125s0011 [Sinapis alba]
MAPTKKKTESSAKKRNESSSAKKKKPPPLKKKKTVSTKKKRSFPVEEYREDDGGSSSQPNKRPLENPNPKTHSQQNADTSPTPTTSPTPAVSPTQPNSEATPSAEAAKSQDPPPKNTQDPPPENTQDPPGEYLLRNEEKILRKLCEEMAGRAIKPHVFFFFKPAEYGKACKLSTMCHQHSFINLIKDFDASEKKWFHDHPQFKHLFHMECSSKRKVMGVWMLLLRTTKVDKKRPFWLVVNGVPIRYSIIEHGLLSRLYCHRHPENYESFRSLRFAKKHFQQNPKKKGDDPPELRVTPSDVLKKLKGMKYDDSHERLKITVVYFLATTIREKSRFGSPIEPFLLQIEIQHMVKHFRGKIPEKANWTFHGFINPLEILAFESIPVLKENFRECKELEKEGEKEPEKEAVEVYADNGGEKESKKELVEGENEPSNSWRVKMNPNKQCKVICEKIEKEAAEKEAADKEAAKEEAAEEEAEEDEAAEEEAVEEEALTIPKRVPKPSRLKKSPYVEK